ncbi:hypothetical protein NC653_036344 [Populus alba x Populus x berolinensis]|uniref:Uncharacterized protein n=1 Tax=Populus alba x Populus x berolinensis TaxID=444605 RepID=A0AAD6LJY3_9ROSI|nr:hypothetical protein NC653_036344 [Populus alba x Populus x berolinensis]
MLALLSFMFISDPIILDLFFIFILYTSLLATAASSYLKPFDAASSIKTTIVAVF